MNAGFKIGTVLRCCREKIDFSGAFLCDFIASVAYVIATAYLYNASAKTAPTTAELEFIVAVVLCAQVAKVLFMFSLDRRGGDARTSKRSRVLVTDGVYGYSRNPAYLVTVVRDAAWSLFLLFAMVDGQAHIGVIAIAVLLPFVHLSILDRFFIPREEADLLRSHPGAYPAYAVSVNRWIGRRFA
jgi:protein-S-isoprenylcysteine O-methyltransferase Ste14